ncbi:MAG: cytochrome c maturation protein CcmE [Gammaproteobacteria bacterium]|nr:cytochrome c maturation protein CcmE [Gammaproteobacteria bacterium]MBU1653622.1 cytochrome c maturation protein CcmE [Gammaproteobacteria bacterium]MBU1962698.1 cytochrome c maturation protein CcmE [Gammaproteobacteria bacterium]
MKPRQKRLLFAAIGLAGVAAAAVLITQALRSNIAYSFGPSQVAAGEAPKDHVFRLAGMVKKESFKRTGDGLTAEFVVTDTAQDVTVRYNGILPDLFKEGQGTVAKGRLAPDGVFLAEEVLAKHDETYMPPEAADAMKKGQEKSLEEVRKAAASAR